MNEEPDLKTLEKYEFQGSKLPLKIVTQSLKDPQNQDSILSSGQHF